MTESVLFLLNGFDPDPPLDDYLTLLPQQERERALRYRHALDRWRFVIGRLMTRFVMAPYAGCSPRDLPLTTNDQNRPVVTGLRSPQFSLAHSGRLVALLVSDGACGVDAELIRAERVSELLYRRIVGRCDEPRDVGLFFRYWTRKEAVMKAHGLGLSLAQERIAVDFAGATAGVVRVDGLDMPLWVSDLSVVSGYALATALEGEIASSPAVQSVTLSELAHRY